MTIADNPAADAEATVRTRVRDILLDLAPVKSEEVRSDLALEADLGYNSLALLEAVVVLEEELGIVLANDGSLSTIRTVADIEDYVLSTTRDTDV